MTGITGSRSALPAGVPQLLARVRNRTTLPVAAGFGISRPADIARLRGRADAAIVGSAIVSRLDEGREPDSLVRELLTSCK